MVIQHNLPAMNSHRQMGMNNISTSKNLEKLSSGYKINRAGDDAAGLAISEKMRGQIRGLNMATQNANNGISLIQTAEGGLNETHDILQRMRELAVQSANGTYDDDTDRANLTKEVEALKSEIDRISSATNYNGISLLDGSLGGKATTTALDMTGVASGAYAISSATKGSSAFDAIAGLGSDGKDFESELQVTYQIGDETKSVTVKLSKTEDDAFDATDEGNVAKAYASALKDTELGNMFKIEADGDGKFTFTALEAGASAPVVTGLAERVLLDDTTATPTAAFASVDATTGPTAGVDESGKLTVATLAAGDKFTINGEKFEVVADAAAAAKVEKGVNAFVAGGNADNLASLIQQKTGVDAKNAAGVISIPLTSAKGDGLTFQIGANGSADQKVTLKVGDMSTSGLGVKGVSVATQDQANSAIDLLDKAINQVSGQRADLGALQNRLEHTVNNLGTTKENLQAAESSIRDVDMAKEMMEFTKNNILVQASQSMLAQSNQLPQGVLQLLR